MAQRRNVAALIVPLLSALTLGGCTGAAPDVLGGHASHLGAETAARETAANPDDAAIVNRPRSGKPFSTRVLSAIAFERATGYEAHPRSLVGN